MRTRTVLVSGAAVIFALGLGSVALLSILEGPRPARPPPLDPAPVPGDAGPAGRLPPRGSVPAAAVATADVATVPPAGDPVPGSQEERSMLRSRPHASAGVAWPLVPEAARAGDLGPALAGPVTRGLEAARDQADSCFREEEARLARRPAAPPRPGEPGPPVLVLRLESRGGALDVAETEVQALGSGSRELVDCVRHVLRGWPIPAPGAVPGKRYRLAYPVL